VRPLLKVIALGCLLAMGASLFGCHKAPPPTPTHLSAAEIVERSSEAVEAVSYFHFTLEHEGGGTPIALGLEMQRAEGDVAKPGRLQMEVSATRQAMPVEVESITIGEETYLRMTFPIVTVWEPLPSEFSSVALFDPEAGVAALMREVADVVRLDDAVTSGTRCYHLRGKMSSEQLVPILGSSVLKGMPIEAEVWVGKADFLPYQIKFSGRMTEAEAEGVIRTLRLSRFDQRVSITPPPLE